ncbi:unnamed protein product [Ranitomeya imitator]|uniref:Chromo domain-containing protein n=1 Tax=Ranitomeya imitator TaxID=111125 RepID=A0ABN9LD98_9NEOB|nr:unnamed protein product [Ranitomeya imitator]
MKVSSRKFKPRFIGPYKISEIINPVSFRLALPPSFAIHNVFHISLLRRYVVPVVPSVDPPAPVLVEGELEYVVEKILDSRFSRRKLQYLVKWKGYGQEDNSWVVASDVHATDLVCAFHLARPDRPGGSDLRQGQGGILYVWRKEGLSIITDADSLLSVFETLPSFVRDTTDVLKRLDGLILDDDVVCHLRRPPLPTAPGNGDGGVLCAFVRQFCSWAVGEGIRSLTHLVTARFISWLRYIDDILFIWQGSASQLESFLCRLNSNIFNIKLTWKYSQTTVDFLDLQISKLNYGSVSTDIFRKATATNSLLHFTSSHPPKLKSSIPIGQFLRARRICSDDTAFHVQARDLRQRFKNRGYPNQDISPARSTLLSKPSCKKNKTCADATPRFITKFNSNWTEINQIFKKHWSVSAGRQRFAATTHALPFYHLAQIPDLGTKEFSNAKGDKIFKIVHHITCDTEAVCISCQLPLWLHIRGSLKIRIQEHVRDIKNAVACSEPHLLKPIARHFFDTHECNPRGLSVRGIDRVYMGIRGGNLKQKLLQKETRWIVTLDTLSPNGLNETISFKSFL